MSNNERRDGCRFQFSYNIFSRNYLSPAPLKILTMKTKSFLKHIESLSDWAMCVITGLVLAAMVVLNIILH